MAAPETRDIATWVALFGLGILAFALLGLMAMVAPHVLGIVLILGAFVGFGAFHYVVWGWWLKSTMSHRGDGDADQQSEPTTPAE